MKNVFIILVVFVLGGLLGSQFDQYVGLSDGDKTASLNTKEKEPMYWVAPMDKNYRRDGPGQSPMGMDLVPVYEEAGAGSDEGMVKITPVVENNLGVKTALVSTEKLVMPVETVGTVQFDESKISHIHSRVEGWIEVLNVSSSGDSVKKGQTLYELYSPALVNAQEEYLAALKSGNKNIIRASKQRLLSLGLPAKQARRLEKRRKVDQRIRVIAEHDGVVIDLKVRQGMYIKPATEVLSIGSLDSVWVLGEIFERQSYLVEKGQDVEVELNAMPGKKWNGRLNYIYPQLDPKTRTLSIRVLIQNPGHFLKPNMLANVRVLSLVQGDSQSKSLSIPRQALIKAGRATRVVKALGGGKFKSVLVEAGFEGVLDGSDEERIQILKGLSQGDKVVTSAQFLIDSESNIEAELSRMEGQSKEKDKKTGKDLKLVTSVGVVNQVMPTMNMINLTHEAIQELNWPVMKMSFSVSEDVALTDYQKGQKVRFTLRVDVDNDFEIETLELLNEVGGVL